MLAQKSLPDLVQWTAQDIQPPFYYLLLWLTSRLFGQSEYALRLPSALANTLTMPVIYLLAKRLFRARAPQVGLVAALILATSPVMVYYSQESRMYTLLVLEATLSSYLLLKITHAPPKGREVLLPRPVSPFEDKGEGRGEGFVKVLSYIAITTLALYTHYFAFFLWLAQAIYILLYLSLTPKTNKTPLTSHFSSLTSHFSPLTSHFLLLILTPILLFIPWLPILLARLGDDPSYWPGALKLNEALRKLLISFTLGETVFEDIGFWLALAYLVLLLLPHVSLYKVSNLIKVVTHVFLTTQIARHVSLYKVSNLIKANNKFSPLTSQLSFLTLWLCLPPSLILALSYQSPKFNPRYMLLSWPPFALIVAAMITPINSKQRRWPFIISLTFILITAAFSLTNWFTDPRFAKTDFRAVAQFIKERKSADETVLLSSGHFFPVWAYYYGWQGWTALPADMPSLDVNRVINLNIAAPLAVALQNQQGAWLVNWQDEVIDPNGVVPFWLDWVGERPHDAGDFWGLRLEHWRLTHPERLTESPIKTPLNLNFSHYLKLIGLTQLNDHELGLFWQAQQPLPPELTLTLNLSDSDEQDWARATSVGQLGSFSYPPNRWPLGQTIITRHALPWQLGTPPGLYRAEIGLGVTNNGIYQGWDVLDEQGRPQRRNALLEPINLSQLIKPATGWQPLSGQPVIDFSPIIILRKLMLPHTQAEPGDRLLLAALWQAGDYNLDDISLKFEVVDSQNQLYLVGESATPSRHYNLYRWRPGEVVLGQYWLNIPPLAAPGPAQLQLHLLNSSGFVYDEMFHLADLEILPTQRNFTVPAQFDKPLAANFADQAELLGLDCANDCQAKSGQTLTLTLTWRGGGNMAINYTIFAHLLDEHDTMLLAADHAPPKPTRGWVKGEIIRDEISLTLPTDLPPGDYPFEVGLYNAADPAFTRLTLPNGETRLLLPQLIKVVK